MIVINTSDIVSRSSGVFLQGLMKIETTALTTGLDSSDGTVSTFNSELIEIEEMRI